MERMMLLSEVCSSPMFSTVLDSDRLPVICSISFPVASSLMCDDMLTGFSFFTK